MKALLKFGGLAFSGLLTLSLFLRLFGWGAYGLFMALAALALFEVGAAGWAHLLTTARDTQRTIAKNCLVLTVALSLISSITEIVLATQFGEQALAALDLEFLTLLTIGIALSANVIGTLAYEHATPELASKLRELDRQARARKAAYDLEDKVTNLAITRAEAEVDVISAEVANQLGLGLRDGVVARLLATAPRRELAAPVEVETPDFPTRPAAKPVLTKASKNGHKPEEVKA